MAQFVFRPEWFFGIDHTFEFISMVTGFLIAFFAYKAYKLNENENYKYFSLAFGAIGLSFVFKILSSLVTYGPFVSGVKAVPVVAAGVQVLERVGWSHILSFMLHQGLMMLAFFILLVTAWKIRNKSIILLFGYLTIVVLALGYRMYHIMPLTLAILIGLTFNHYRIVYNKKKNKNTKLVALAFLFLWIAQIMLLFVRYRSIVYVAAEVIQLGGYLIFLGLYIKLLKR